MGVFQKKNVLIISNLREQLLTRPQLGPSQRAGSNKLEQNQLLKSVWGQSKNVVSQRIKLGKRHQKKTPNSGSHSHTWDTPAAVSQKKARNKASMRNRERQERCCRGQTPRVQPPLSDSFQWKLDTHMHINSSDIKPCRVITDFLSISATLPLRPS